MSKGRRGDLVLSVALVLFSLGGLIFVLMTFPRKEILYAGITFLGLGFFSLVQTFEALRSLKETAISKDVEASAPERVDNWAAKATLVTVIGTFAYILLLELIGFVPASALLVVGLTVYLGYRNILVIFTVSFVIIVAVYMLFSKLYVPVPTGTLWKALKTLIG